MARLSDIRLRRSAVSGSIPSTSNLNLGELALNTADGKVYMKKSVGGTDSVVEVGGSSSGITSTFTAYEYTATANQTTFSGSDNYSNTLAYNTGTPPKVQVFMNGILLDEGSSQDYTGTNGTSVVLTTGADAGDLIQIHAYKSDVSVSSNINFGDNKKLQFGDAQDLQIYHDGSHSYIKDAGTGNLQILATNFQLNNSANSQNMITATDGGAVTLFTAGSAKLATTSTGVQITGTVNVNGAYTLPTSDGSSGQALVSDGSGTLSFATVSGGAVTSMSDTDGDTKIQVEESSDEDKIRFDANGVEIVRMGFNSSSESTLEIVRNGVPAAQGQLTFNGSGLVTNATSGYHSLIVTNGSSEHLRVRSNGNVGIGESSPGQKLQVNGNIRADGHYYVGGQIVIDSNRRILADDGAANVPYITFAGDTNTGLYRPGTDILGFSTAGTERLRIAANGDIFGRTADVRIGSNIGAVEYGTTTANSVRFYSDDTERMRITSAGNVGIGESSPDTTLHITAASPAITLQESDVSTDFNKTEFQSSGGTLLFNTREEDGTFVSTDYAIGKNANGATAHTWSIAGSTKVQLDSSYFDIESGGFRVDDPGNNYPFVVSAYGYMTTRSSSITQLNATDHANVPLSILADVASTRTANYMSVGDIGSAGNRFVIDEVGNVGIGATNPALQSAGTGLHINASAHSEIKFTNSTTGSGASDGTALVATGSGFQINNREAGSILLRTSNTTAVTIDSAQNTAFAGNITTSGSISSGNITTTGYLRGPSTFTIDPAAHGDNTGTLVIAGNLQVDGTTTTINSTTLTVDDKNITLASGSSNKAAANSAGITVDCGSDTDARITYASTTDEWDINKSIHVSGAAGSGVKIDSGGAIVGGGATGGDTQLMYWGGGPVYYGRSSAGGTVSGHEFRVGGVTKLNVNSSGNTIASGTVSVLGGEIFLGTANSSSGHINAFENMSFNIDSDNDDTNRFFEWNVNGNSGSGTELMRLTEDGKLGIGTDSPVSKLTVGDSTTNATAISISTPFATNNYGDLVFTTVGTTTYNARIRATVPGNGTRELSFITAKNASENTVMTLDGDGKVGIGTTAPARHLVLYGTAASTTSIQFQNADTGAAAGDGFGVGLDSTEKGFIWNYEGNDTYIGGAGGTSITVQNGGNVGIGATSPVAKLQIEVLGIETNQSSVTSTNQFECEAMSATAFRSARYTVQVTNVTDSTYQITEILLIHDGTTPSITEYGTIFTGSAAEASFDADIASGNVRLLATPASADNMQFKVVRHSILI